MAEIKGKKVFFSPRITFAKWGQIGGNLADQEDLQTFIEYATDYNLWGETTENKVSSLSHQSTDVQYPTAKCVYEAVNQLDWLYSQLGATVAGKQDKLTSANAGENVTITEEDGVVKISATGGGGGVDNWVKIEDITVEEEAVVSRTYAQHYKKLVVLAYDNVNKLPKFKLAGGVRYWTFYSYSNYSQPLVTTYGEIVIPNTLQDVRAFIGSGGGNGSQVLPVTESIRQAASYFNGFATENTCKVGATISVYGVLA